MHDIPLSAPSALAMTSAPMPRFATMSVWTQQCGTQFPRILAMLHKKESQPMLNALEKSWEDTHYCIFHHMLPTLLDAKPNRTRKPSCIDAGVCLCGPKGTMIWNLKRWLTGNLIGAVFYFDPRQRGSAGSGDPHHKCEVDALHLDRQEDHQEEGIDEC